jgi:hypothetical protein
MDVATLAALAGSTLVTAAVTDAWEDVRHKVAQLFGRGEPDPGIERRLDATRDQVTTACPPDLQRAQAALAAQWQTRFANLLANHPDAEAELAALVDELKLVVPAAADHSVSAGRDLNVTADRGSVAAGVIHGDVTLPVRGFGP